MVVLGVNAWDEEKSVVAKYAKDKQLKHRMLLNGNGVANTYGVREIPYLLWIDKNGVVVDVAAEASHEVLKKKTLALLSSGA